MTTPATAQALFDLTLELDPAALPLAYTVLHCDDTLHPEVRNGIIHTLGLVAPAQPATRVDEALATIVGIRAAGMHGPVAMETMQRCWRFIVSCDARPAADAALAWMDAVRAIAEVDGVTVH